MSVEDRKLEVLRAIVEDFIATNEPVGSKALADRHNLGVSPGDDPQRHGRARGGGADRPAAHQRRAGADRRRATGCSSTGSPSVKPLSAPSGARSRPSSTAPSTSTTCCTAPCARSPSSPATSPSCSTRRCRAAGCGTSSSSRSHRSRLMLVLITDTGRVEQRVVELPGAGRRRGVADLRSDAERRSCATGCWPRRRRSSPTCPARSRRELRGLLATLTTVLLETLVEPHSDRIVLGGTANLDRARARLPGDPAGARGAGGAGRAAAAARPVGGLEPGAWCGSATRTSTRGWSTRRWSPAGTAPRGAALGAVGVLGPRRMDYAHTMARVAAVARYVGDLLASADVAGSVHWHSQRCRVPAAT